MSSGEVVHHLWPSAQPQHNQRLGKSISSSYESYVSDCVQVPK